MIRRIFDKFLLGYRAGAATLVISLLIPAEFWIAPSLELAFAGLKALLQIVRLSATPLLWSTESELMDSDSEAPGRTSRRPAS
jgi:hypothetical protein